MRAEESLRFIGGLFGIARPALDERVGMLLDLAGLGDEDTKIGGYSRGMKQLDRGRLIAQAPIDELKARYGHQKVVVEVTGGADELAEQIRRQGWTAAVSRGHDGTLTTWGLTVAIFGQAPGSVPWSASMVWLMLGILFIALTTLLSVLIGSGAGAAGAMAEHQATSECFRCLETWCRGCLETSVADVLNQDTVSPTI